jgi:4-carboxymuconolactone decarboxylase
VRGALNRGATREEIVETITQCAPYIGFPKTNHALRAAKRILDQWGQREDWRPL